MNSLILQVGGRLLLPLSLAFSIWLLLRGHNEPGGGFVGGLVAAAGVAVHSLPRGRRSMARLLRIRPISIAATGLLLAVLSGLPALWLQAPFLTHQWVDAAGFALGTPVLFDCGVYLAVAGSVLAFLDPYLDTARGLSRVSGDAPDGTDD
jgi:multicomponent Na+:H+ antiporter subunit B